MDRACKHSCPSEREADLVAVLTAFFFVISEVSISDFCLLQLYWKAKEVLCLFCMFTYS